MKPILLATDGSPTAEEATKKAIELAKLFETELLVVTAWDIPYSTLGYAAIPPFGEMLAYGHEQAKKVAGDAAREARAAGVGVQTYVVRGFPVEQIGGAVKKFEPAIVVLGSHGWGPMKRMLFGSVSTGVLHHAAVPVLIVPPASLDGEVKATRGVREEVTV
jgi:nucleotide-binding universal stress UspA family protein